MSTIGPGDFVECIESDSYAQARVDVGQVYRVKAMPPKVDNDCSLHGECDGDPVLLDGVPLPWGHGWCSLCFRPLYRPQAGLFAAALEPRAAPAQRDLVDA